jgi:molybdate transport system substrate-binding protein
MWPEARLRAVLLPCLAAAGCAGERADSVIALVAASAGDAVEEIAAAFRTETGVDVKVSTGASNALAMQILEGAPAHVFLSASPEWSGELRARGLVSEERPLLSNALVIVVPAGNPAGVRTPGDLASAAVRKLALAGEKVPAGKYARQALERLGVSAAVEGKVVRGQDVRMALAYVERGEAEAGIVYATDARASRAVEAVYTFPAGSHETVIYPLLLLERGAKSPAARRLFERLSSPATADVFRSRGFTAAGGKG